MARLPDANALGPAPTPVSNRPTGGYQGGIAEAGDAAIGDAVARVGSAVAKTGDQIQDAQDHVDYASAQQAFLDAKLKADQSAIGDTDYATLPQRYQESVTKAANDIGATLRNPSVRAQFQTSVGRLINFSSDSIFRLAHSKSVDAGRGSTMDAINAGIEQALQAADEPTRVAALQGISTRIDSAQNAGWFTATEAAKMRKTVPEQYAERRAKMLIDADPTTAFTMLAPPGMENAPGLAPKRRVQIPETAALASENNNPGNLKFVGQPGAQPGDGGFAKFATPEDGYSALENQVSLDASRGATLGSFIQKYAPPNENNTDQYISQATSALGVSPDTKLSDIPQDKLVSFIAQKESGAKIITDGGDGATVQPASALSSGAPGSRDVVFPKTGDWRDFFSDPSKRMDLARQAQQRADQIRAANEVNAARTERLAQKQKQDAYEAAVGKITSQLIKDPSQVDPVRDIADNPAIPGDHKWAVFQMVNAANKETDKDSKAYGPGFYDAYQAVHAPDGDPNRITDPSQLYSRVGPNGDLTVAGVDKLAAEIQGRRTPEGLAEGEMKKGAVAYAKHQLSFEMDYGSFKLPDPKGQDAFNIGFLPAFYQAYDAGRKAGKTPYQLLSKDSPDFIVDKVIAPFKRTDAQRTKDMMEAGAGAASTGGSANPLAGFDLNTAPGIAAAYRAGKLTKEAAEQAARDKGFIQPPAGPRVPVGN